MAKKEAKNKKAGATVSKIYDLISGEIEALGYIIWSIDYKKEGASDTLEITIDRQGGVSLEDCEKVTRAINPILDEADPIPGAYYLEVSSAGIDRVLSTPSHYDFYIGKPIEVRFYAPDEKGNRFIRGTLNKYTDTSLFVTVGDEEEEIPLKKAAQIKAYEEL